MGKRLTAVGPGSGDRCGISCEGRSASPRSTWLRHCLRLVSPVGVFASAVCLHSPCPRHRPSEMRDARTQQSSSPASAPRKGRPRRDDNPFDPRRHADVHGRLRLRRATLCHPDAAVAGRRSCLLARFVRQPNAARGGDGGGLPDGRNSRRTRHGPFGLQPLGQLPLGHDSGHRAQGHGPGREGGKAEDVRRKPLSGTLGSAAAADPEGNARDDSHDDADQRGLVEDPFRTAGRR